MEERRRTGDQQLGYLVGKVEELTDHVKEVARDGSETRQLVVDLQQEVALKFKTAEVVFKTLKVLGLIIGAVLTFKFGDIKALWELLH